MAISRLTHNRKLATPLRLTFRSPILLLNLLIRISLFLRTSFLIRSSFMRRILPLWYVLSTSCLINCLNNMKRITKTSSPKHFSNLADL